MSFLAWTAVGACATGAMAIATFLVVWQSRSLSQETKKLAVAASDSLKISQDLLKASQQLVETGQAQAAAAHQSVRVSQELVEASLAEAAATRELAAEAQRDRELACQAWIGIEPSPDDEGDFVSVGLPMVVRNIGGGPALGLRAFWWPDHDKTAWSRSLSLHLAPGQAAELVPQGFTPMGPLPSYDWFGHGSDPSARAAQGTLVLFWRDILDYRYRLPVIRFPVMKGIGVRDENVIDPRVGTPERRRAEAGVFDWSSDIRIFPSPG